MYARVNGIQLDVYEHDPVTRATVRRSPDFIRDNLLSFPAPSNLNYLVILEDKSKTQGNKVYRMHTNRPIPSSRKCTPLKPRTEIRT